MACNLSDYFQPMHELDREAKIFCNHKDVHSWFYYDTDRTVRSVLVDDKQQSILELNGIYDYLMSYADHLLHRLESYEKFETCTLVTAQFRKLEAELEQMQAKLENINI